MKMGSVLAMLFRSLRSIPFLRFFIRDSSTRQQNKVCCFHCGDYVSQRRVVRCDFDGASRELCCHGCAAVLRMVEENGLTSQYWQDKSTL